MLITRIKPLMLWGFSHLFGFVSVSTIVHTIYFRIVSEQESSKKHFDPK